jgi:iduronate 2-sulfatase
MKHLNATRREFLGALPALGAAKAAGASGKLNVLFIVSDDMNTALSCYGNPIAQSPHIARLVARGVRFDLAYCQFPLCNPSRASFLSGRRPDSTRVYTLQTPVRRHMEDAVFLPELFRKNGYFTGHAGKVFHTGDEMEDPRSWDEELREFGKQPPAEAVIQSEKANGPIGHSMEWMTLRSKDEETPDGLMARKAVEMMEKAVVAGKPFFVAAGFRRPHSPYAAPKRYFDRYPQERMLLPTTPPSHIAQLVPAAINYLPPAKPMPSPQVRSFLAAYYACQSFTDAQIGVLFAALDRLALWDNTIVVLLSDHGYHLGDHGGLWHKLSLFEESARIPLIVYAPGRRSNGKACQRLVESVDLYPTLTALCGLPAPERLEGSSFVPLLDDAARPWKRAAFTMAGRGSEGGEAPREIRFFGRSIRTERWRFTEWDSGKQGSELYDHERDPGELDNLAAKPEYVKTVTGLRPLLRGGWKSALPG